MPSLPAKVLPTHPPCAGQVQTRALVICFNLFLVKFPILEYIWSSWLSLFCLNIVSIVDWMRWGWSCLSHLCNIFIGQSDIVKVVVFFEPSQFTNHIGTHTEQVLLVSKTDLGFVGILKPCWYFQGWSIFQRNSRYQKF